MSDPVQAAQPFPGEQKSPFHPGATSSAGKRNALLAAAGLGLCAVGVAAGMAFKSAPPAQVSAVQPAVSTVATGAPQVAADNLASASTAAQPPTNVAAATATTPAPATAIAAAPQAVANPAVGAAQPQAAVSTQATGANGVPNYGPATTPAPAPVRVAQAPQPAPRPAVCATCGVVEDVVAVRQKGEGTGLGAVAGGALGGILGHQVGGGTGRTAMTVLGAVGGGFAGHEVEQRARATTSYDVRVRMDNGAIRHFTRQSPPPVGERVVVDRNGMRLAGR